MHRQTQMHHLDATPTGHVSGGSDAERMKRVGFVPQVPSSVMQAADAPGPGDFHRRMSEERLRDPEFRAEYERVYTEMLGHLAPATEGPVVNPGRKRRGRLVFGDDTGEPR